MGAKIVFMRRTPKEVEIFGGEVFIDIDGKNIGKLGSTDFIVQLENGKHKFKMYKSHTYDTYIGFAETEIDISAGNDILIKYSPPMLVNQPGNLIVSDYHSSSQVDSIVNDKDNKLAKDLKIDVQKKTDIEEKNQRGVTYFIVMVVIIAVIYLIIQLSIVNSF